MKCDSLILRSDAGSDALQRAVTMGTRVHELCRTVHQNTLASCLSTLAMKSWFWNLSLSASAEELRAIDKEAFVCSSRDEGNQHASESPG